MAEAASFASVTSAPFLSRRLTGSIGGSPLQPMIFRPKTSDHVRAISSVVRSVSLARSIRVQRGLMSPSKSSSSPEGQGLFLEAQVLEQSADFSANRLRS
ncbi:hypothetical protein FPZ24_03465 [Sphingomonas panacisoli]|uniref:Uncharacterized protein n=1 Tax=Sphingomonas panacisoli TaxID=1813879 RepID=A0A5B8LER9_9SPHN|nr:hypothetical protein [Sphingomonas panacisoli]QDZ06647.1 hypothetical protein FPZ24_03465 [Sphingomonas panacisoli]